MTTLSDYYPEQPPWSTIWKDTDRPGERGHIRTAANPKVGPELSYHGCQTLYDGLRSLGLARNPLGPCLGYRAVSTTGFATPYIYTSYTECIAQMDSLAAGLDALNLIHDPEDPEELAVLAFYCKNCVEVTIGEHAAYAVGACTAILYDTLGPDTVSFILEQTKAKSVVATRLELPQLCKAKQDSVDGKLDTFQNVILINGVTKEAAAMAQEAGLEVLSFAKVGAAGSRLIATTNGGHHHRPPSPDDVAALCYTSGTTGTPKGAMITHKNLISVVAGMAATCPDLLETTPADRHLSYLPLAHIFERVVQAQMLCAGASIAFFRGDPTLLIEDLVACRPTVMPVAPRVLNKIYDKITSGIQAAGGTKQKLFEAALTTKMRRLEEQGILTHGLYDRLIFNKIKKALGMDCIRCMVSGSAPLSPRVMTFFRCILGAPVVEGYGQTEGTAAATIGQADDITTAGHVGGPAGCGQVCLYDVPEMGYKSTDTNHNGIPCVGRGEVCIRGPSVFPGYYKQPDKTKETIDEEGWLHSGDIGLWRPDGNLQIIDRKKNIFKLSQGEYVAPEKIENHLIASPLIGQIMVHGDSLQSCLVALVVPDIDACPLWAKDNAPNLANTAKSFADWSSSPELKAAVMADIKRICSEAKLHGFETPKAIYLVPEAFTVENDLMTPTFKLKRQQVRERYRVEIDNVYDELPKPRSKL